MKNNNFMQPRRQKAEDGSSGSYYGFSVFESVVNINGQYLDVVLYDIKLYICKEMLIFNKKISREGMSLRLVFICVLRFHTHSVLLRLF